MSNSILIFLSPIYCAQFKTIARQIIFINIWVSLVSASRTPCQTRPCKSHVLKILFASSYFYAVNLACNSFQRHHMKYLVNTFPYCYDTAAKLGNTLLPFFNWPFSGNTESITFAFYRWMFCWSARYELNICLPKIVGISQDIGVYQIPEYSFTVSKMRYKTINSHNRSLQKHEITTNLMRSCASLAVLFKKNKTGNYPSRQRQWELTCNDRAEDALIK